MPADESRVTPQVSTSHSRGRRDVKRCYYCRRDKLKCEPEMRRWTEDEHFQEKCFQCSKRTLPCSQGQLPHCVEAQARKGRTDLAESIQSLIPKGSTSTSGNVDITNANSDSGESLFENDWKVITGWLWTDKLCAAADAAQRDKIAAETFLLMALQELKTLATEMARPFNDDHDKSFTDGLPEVKQCLDDYRHFSETIQNEFSRTSTGSRLILQAYHALHVDYGHPNLNWTVNDRWQESQRETIDYFKEMGHMSFAHMLQIRRLLNHASLIDVEGLYILHGRDQFLQEVRHILGNENLSADIPSAFRDCPSFIPRALLDIPSIRDSIQRLGKGDCLGRSPCHIIADAGYLADWTWEHANQVDVLGRSGLYFACRDGQLELVKKFLRLGAKLNQKTVTGSTPLHVAAIGGHLDILGWLCNQFFEELHRAGNAEGGRSLSNVLDERDCIGRSPLFWAASGGHNKIVEYLCMRMGAAKRTKDNFGSTPMSLAVRNGHFAVVKILLDSRFAWDIPDHMGRSPFWYSVSGCHFDIMKELGKYVNIDRKDHRGRTPLAEAASRGFTRGLRYLLSCNEYDKNGNPLRLRVDPASRDKEGKAILVLAAEAGKSDCVSELFRLHPRVFNQDDVAAARRIAASRQDQTLWAALRRPRFFTYTVYPWE